MNSDTSGFNESFFEKEFYTPEGKDRLAKEHIYLVYRVASRTARKIPSHYPFDDLVGAGMIGLMDAVGKFNPELGIKFESYAEFRIKGTILDSLRTSDPLSRESRRRIRELTEAKRELENRLGREVSDDELCDVLSMDISDLHEITSLAMSSNTVDFDSLSEISGADNIPDPDMPTPHEVSDYKDLIERLSSAIARLPDRLATVLSLYYHEELNMKEIGAVLGITESRVSQLRTEALAKLKTIMEEE
ncbi:FliA/WhiG family RNA polymerase sigma factor [Myxococcota bacterium]|nr:FliA/WhiG family RNA polymerase sigma factor [Myxococcota bacterium]MBU1382569.1 FliA/WhiG family RNA polymerase sigma factor [Myxococcota bacterium]MBU1498163.1 FliA/WhiG family RNA polymerase sigma factor [Myxococcota bacterium]